MLSENSHRKEYEEISINNEIIQVNQNNQRKVYKSDNSTQSVGNKRRDFGLQSMAFDSGLGEEMPVIASAAYCIKRTFSSCFLIVLIEISHFIVCWGLIIWVRPCLGRSADGTYHVVISTIIIESSVRVLTVPT